ncbi:hypothetical protein QN277_029088 [Acacia crassicarpa]|uniref:UspA domain-containing protein n=1 Tax=Acacia crassicarpa TaxID=499986 RepID=A0AAE1MFV2_9FABA|nr:hypothetical protein QN277_029088 [Acacia crassicarpa]
MATSSEKQVMMVAIDESEHSFYALKWTLDHFFSPNPNPLFKLILVHARPSAIPTLGLAATGANDVLPHIDAALKRTAAQIVEKAKELCIEKLVNDVEVEVREGDARNVLCDAVDKHHASVLVVGSHNYGTIKRAVLGSVSDYCAHHAHCSVMIVKKPKTSH